MMSGHLVNVGMWLQGTEVVTSPDNAKLVTFVGIIAICVLVLTLIVLGALVAAFVAWLKVHKILHDVHVKSMPLVASVQRIVEDARPKVASITENVRGIVEDVRPKVASISENVRSVVEDATPKAKNITENIRSVVDDATPKAKNITENIRSVVEDATPKAKAITEEVAQTTATYLEKARSIANNVSTTVEDANRKTRAQVDRVDGMVHSALSATSDVAAKIHHGIRVPVNEVAGWINGMKAGIDKLFSPKAPKPATPQPVTPKTSTAGVKAWQSEHSPTQAEGHEKAAAFASGSPTPEQEKATSGRPFSSDRAQAAATAAAENDVLSDPSSAVAPSPGAQEVVDRFLNRPEAHRKPGAVKG